MTVQNVLLIEDDDADAEQVQHLLQSSIIEAHDVVFAVHRSSCLHASLDVLKDQSIDVILLDDALPDGSGVQSIRELQSAKNSPPIVLYTDLSDFELALQAVRAGAHDYLVKENVTANELFRCLLHAIERHKRISTEATLTTVQNQQSRMGALQAHLLPHGAPHVPGYQIAGRSEPAAIAGGDYYDFFELPNGNLGLAIADVSGHELASSLTMAGLRRCLRTCAELSQDLVAMMMQANRSVCQDVMSGHFVVALLAEIDPVTDSVRYLTAGHRGYLIDDDGVHTLETKFFPLGIEENQKFVAPEPVKMAPGSLLVTMTDGIWEAMSTTRLQWGLDNVIARLVDLRRLSADEIVERLFAELAAYCAPMSHDDDAAIIVVKKL
jgi:sigma-B regulation protein RsbU (phosphoserine phosphatase)